jgi:anti-sigma factor RsiW
MTCSAAREALDALLDGELDAAEEAEVLVHLDACPDCTAELAELRRWHLTLSGALGADEARPTPAERRRTARTSGPSDSAVRGWTASQASRQSARTMPSRYPASIV